MSCKINRWKGCAPDRPTCTPASNELSKRLEQMKAERSKLDTMWDTPAQPVQTIQPAPQQQTFYQLK